MLPSSPSADYISDATLRLCFGRAVFCCPFPGERGSTTAHLRRLPRKGRAGGAFKSLLKHRVQGTALPAMLPSSPSADYISVCTFTALLRQSRFLLPLSRRTGEHDCASPAVAPQGASRRRSKSLLKHRVQGAALPAMLPSSPSADYISDALLRLCFGRAVFLLPLSRRTGEHDCASPTVAPQGASRRRSKSLLKHRVLKQKAWVCVYSANFL